MNRKRLIVNLVEGLLLVLMSILFVWINPGLREVKNSLISIEKLIEITLILIGLGTTFVTFLYTIISNIKSKNENNIKVKEELVRITKSVNINMYRLIGSFSILLTIYLLIGVDIPYVKESRIFNKINISAVIGVSTLIYISCSVLDITISSIKLYLHDIER